MAPVGCLGVQQRAGARLLVQVLLQEDAPSALCRDHHPLMHSAAICLSFFQSSSFLVAFKCMDKTGQHKLYYYSFLHLELGFYMCLIEAAAEFRTGLKSELRTDRPWVCSFDCIRNALRLRHVIGSHVFIHEAKWKGQRARINWPVLVFFALWN